MVDIKDTEYAYLEDQIFEKFKNGVIDMLNTLNTNHFTIFLSNGAEIDINYKEHLINSYYVEVGEHPDGRVVKVEQWSN